MESLINLLRFPEILISIFKIAFESGYNMMICVFGFQFHLVNFRYS